MEYQAIYACPHDDILYYKEHVLKGKFPKCDERRYQTDNVTKNMTHKVLRYIPIIPRMRQLFRWKSIIELMGYHAMNRSEDRVLRMPANGSAFRNTKEKWLEFKI